MIVIKNEYLWLPFIENLWVSSLLPPSIMAVCLPPSALSRDKTHFTEDRLQIVLQSCFNSDRLLGCSAAVIFNLEGALVIFFFRT